MQKLSDPFIAVLTGRYSRLTPSSFKQDASTRVNSQMMSEEVELQQPVSGQSSPALSGRSSSLDEAFNEEHAEKQPIVDRECVSYTYEESSKMILSQKLREKWSRAALGVSLFAILVTIGISLASFMVCKETESSSIFASAFDTMLGAFSSLVVAWRFRDVKNGEVAPAREETATLGIALSFVVSGIAVITTSVLHLAHGDHPERADELISILGTSLVCFSTLGYVQNCISSKLHSQCLKTAAIDSWLAAAMSAGILVSTFIYRQTQPDLWFTDHLIALLIGVTSCVYGLKLAIVIGVLRSTVVAS